MQGHFYLALYVQILECGIHSNSPKPFLPLPPDGAMHEAPPTPCADTAAAQRV